MKFVIGFTSTGIGCVILLRLLLSCSVADASDTLTLIYSGEEQGQLGLHGCGADSALELVCTGQVYLPTITFVIGVEEMRGHALSYLVLYNLMFVTPLLVVFGFVYWGTTSVQLGGVLQRHLMPVKLGIGVLLFGLGMWLLFSVA